MTGEACSMYAENTRMSSPFSFANPVVAIMYCGLDLARVWQCAGERVVPQRKE